ncbi:acyl-CoA synthetase [Microbacterium shaanxiense]
MRAHYSDVWQAISRVLPERVAIRTADEEWSYARFTREAGAFAGALAQRGVARGDRVALLLYNRPEFLVALYACLGAGITPVPLNFRFRSGEVAALLDDSGAKALVYTSSLTDVATDAVAQSTGDIALIQVDDDGSSADAPGLTWAEAIGVDAKLPAHAPDDAELWIYTGGTTGRPKAVRWDAQDMFEVQMFSTYTLAGLAWPETVTEAASIAASPDTPLTVNLPLAPFMHGTALTTSMNTFTLGGTVLVTSSPKLDADAAVRFANDASATRIIVAGDAVAVPLVESIERLGQGLPTVTSVISSGMRFSPEVKARLHTITSLTVIDLLASSEGGAFAVTTTTGVQDLPGRPRLQPTATVLDDEQREVHDRPGALGVLAQRGALPIGYHGDPDKTAATFPVINGIRHVVPGDLVRVQEDGYFEFLGRGSGVINTGGEKVYPLEVEEALLTHPEVADVVVVGVPDARFGEIVTAVVERTARSEVTSDDLIGFIDPILAGYKRPRHILFRASMDRTPTGKVDLARMRREIALER